VNVAKIEMPADVARAQLRNLRRSLHKRADAEYEQIAAGLEKLSEGTPLLSLSAVFDGVARDTWGRPLTREEDGFQAVPGMKANIRKV